MLFCLIVDLYLYFSCTMDKKYVIRAFDRGIKGRFDVLAEFYGPRLFKIPAAIMCEQIQDELGIRVTESSLYNLKRRLKKTEGFWVTLPEPAKSSPDQQTQRGAENVNQLVDQILQPTKPTTSSDKFKI